MRKLLLISLVLGCTVLAFFAGQSRGSHRAAAPPAAGGRKVLYYVDPMNPAHTSDRPGMAPCGMKMEPVYAEAGPGIALGASMGVMPPGTVKINSEWQQRLGIRVAKPERKALRRSLHFSGRVAVDEARLYRVNAALNGWITRTLPFTTGSAVKKDEVLACFYNPDFLTGVQGMLFYLSGRDRTLQMTNVVQPPAKHLAMLDQNLTQNIDTLQNMGMGQSQIERILEARSFDKNVEITSPADGFVLQRNVSEGLRFDKGAETRQHRLGIGFRGLCSPGNCPVDGWRGVTGHPICRVDQDWAVGHPLEFPGGYPLRDDDACRLRCGYLDPYLCHRLHARGRPF